MSEAPTVEEARAKARDLATRAVKRYREHDIELAKRLAGEALELDPDCEDARETLRHVRTCERESEWTRDAACMKAHNARIAADHKRAAEAAKAAEGEPKPS